MYRMKVKIGKSYRWGIRTYKSLEEAEQRKKELTLVGIHAIIKLESELLK